MHTSIDKASLDQIFDEAHTLNKWTSREVPDALLREIFNHMRWPPTSANCSPLRVVFVKSQEAKEKLKPHLDKGNVDKTMAAPATAIFAIDYKFYEYLPRLFPAADAKSWFAGNKPKADTTAFRNATLQAGYFILAARALGLDCGPMSGFNNDGVDSAFFGGTDWKSNFLCNLGYGDPSGIYPRSPRFEFDEIARIA